MNNNITPTPSSISATLLSSINQIPSELLNDKNIFDTVLRDNDLWSMVCETKKEEILTKHLPSSLKIEDKEETVKMLFDNKLKRFDDNLMETNYFQLKLQRISPDLSKTLEEINKLKRKAFILQEQKYQCQLLTEILTQRRILFQMAADSSPHGISLTYQQETKASFVAKNMDKSFHKRRQLSERRNKVRQRYKMEMKKLFPEDENNTTDDSDLELDDAKLPRSNFFHADSILKSGSLCKYKRDITSSREEYITMMKKFRRKRKALLNNDLNDPVMDISNITLSDIISRVANDSEDENSEKGLPLGEFKSNSPFAPNNSKLLSNSSSPSVTTAPSLRKKSKQSSTSVNKMPLPLFPPLSSAPLLAQQLSLQTSTSCQTPITSLPSLITNSNSLSPPKKSECSTILNVNSVKREPLDIFDFDNDSPPHSFPLPPLSLSSSTTSNPVPVTSFSALLSQSQQSPIMTPLTMAPILSSNPEPTVPSASIPQASPPPPPPPLLLPLPPTTPTTPAPLQTPLSFEKPPASFFSLIRDSFYTNSSNDKKLTLHKLEELVKEKLRVYDPKLSWSHEMVQSAMNYLSEVFPPPDMIPLVDYKEKNQLWQWIGVNRDSDCVLTPLCKEWLKEKDKKKTTSLMDPSEPVPPAICPTDWTVRSSSDEEKKGYRDQEALRYNSPHKAFTFTIHGYNSVVGPVKGCGIGGSTSHSASPNKAREHSLLVKDRPPFVTLLSLVRDAAARLPNGEGTRADICELLKDSQYLLPTVSDQQVNGIVSGALDRLHYEKDPCVKYDVNRKVWIYLHRNRSEEEFERLHEVQVAAAKAKRILNKTQRKASTISNSPRTGSTNSSGKQASAKSVKNSSNSTPKPSIESQLDSNNTSNFPSTSPSVSLASTNHPVTTSSSTFSTKTSITSPPSTTSPNFTNIVPSSLASTSSPSTNSLNIAVTSISLNPPNSSNRSSIANTHQNAKKRSQKPKLLKKGSESSEPESLSNLVSPTVKNIAFTCSSVASAISIAPLPSTAPTLPPFEKIAPAPSTATLEPFSSLISGSDKSLQSQISTPIRPASKSINSLMKVTPVVSPTVHNITRNVDSLQHFFGLTTKSPTTSNNVSFTTATKVLPSIIDPMQPEPQQILVQPQTQSLFGKSVLNPFDQKQSRNQPLTHLQSHTLVQQNITTQPQIQPQQQPPPSHPSQLPSQIITLQPSSISCTTPSQALQQIQQIPPQSQQIPQQPSQLHHQIHQLQPQFQQLQPQLHQLQGQSLSSKSQFQAHKIPKTQITLPRQIQVHSSTTTSPSISAPTQISIPTSMLFGGRPGSVVLATPAGKSYMMAASGGQIVLHPQVTGTNTLQTSTNNTIVTSTTGVTNASTSLAVRTLQGIRVIPVTTGIPVQRATSSSIIGPNTVTVASQSPGGTPSHHHVVARIITTSQATRGSTPQQAQIVIPSTSTIQPILLTSSQQLPNRSE